MSPLRLALAGDICPTGGKRYHICAATLGDDVWLANLECPMTTHGGQRPKAGPNLRAHPQNLEIDCSEGTAVCSLANNHMMDYGEQGLVDTLNKCKKLGIETAGAGMTSRRAGSPVFVLDGGVSLGILACCETQFGIASPSRPGVSPVSPALYRQIGDLREEVDIVAVSVHGGAEMSPWPTPHWQDLLRSFVDEGASVVHGHHSHVPQSYEEYKDGLILYGLGNFLVEPARWTKKPNTLWSVVCDVSLSQKGVEGYAVRTVRVIEGEYVEALASGDQQASEHQRYLSRANTVLADRELLTGVWQESAVRMYYSWYARWLGFASDVASPRGKERANSVLDQLKTLLCRYDARNAHGAASQDKLLLWYHLFACESHRDSIATALGVLGGELDDMRTEAAKRLVDEMMPWSRGYRQ